MRHRAVIFSTAILLACSVTSSLISNSLPRAEAANSPARGFLRRRSTAGVPTQDSRLKTPDSGPGTFKLTIDNIMRGPGLVGYEPRAVRWSPDCERIYFEWKQASDPAEKDFDTYVVNRDGTGLRKLSEDEALEAPPAGGEMTLDRKMTVVARRGDIWVYDSTKSEMHRITSTSDIESNPHFTRDGQSVYFTRSSNLYVMRLGTGALAEMTDIRPPGSAPEPSPGGRGPAAARASATESQSGQERLLTDSQQYMKKEEEELFDVVKERVRRRKDEEALQKRLNPRKPFQLRPNQTIASLQLSPDQKYVIAQVVDPGTGARATAVPEYVTESGYTENIPGRTNVGDLQPKTRIAIIDSHSGEVKWLDHGIKAPPPSRPPVAKPEEKPETAESRSAVGGDGTAA